MSTLQARAAAVSRERRAPGPAGAAAPVDDWVFLLVVAQPRLLRRSRAGRAADSLRALTPETTGVPFRALQHAGHSATLFVAAASVVVALDVAEHLIAACGRRAPVCAVACARRRPETLDETSERARAAFKRSAGRSGGLQLVY